MDNKGTNPLADLVLLARIWRLLRAERPLCVLSYTIKPNIYTALAARMLGIPVVTNIAGLGSVFVTRGWVMRVVRELCRVALRKSFRVFFQNRDDHEYFVREGLVDPACGFLLPGSGVDAGKFSPRGNESANSRPFRFLMFGRLLWEKGVREYVDAARSLKPKYPDTKFRLLGFVDVENPSAVSRNDVNEWLAEGCVDFHEATDDVPSQIATADCVVLPTYYREGIPRSLIEAVSMEKPVITTDSPGCRDAVSDGVTGYLVKMRDTPDLIEKMEKMLRLDSAERTAMGRRARQKMLHDFDEKIVIRKYLEAVEEIPPVSE